MKKIILGCVVFINLMFGASSDIDTFLKQKVWFIDNKTYDNTVIKDVEIKKHFLSLHLSMPTAARIIVDNFQAKNCKDDLSFLNNTSIYEINKFLESKQYKTLLNYAYEKPYQYINIKNNAKYIMCGTESFTPDISTLNLQKGHKDNVLLYTPIEVTLVIGYIDGMDQIQFNDRNNCKYLGQSSYSKNTERVFVNLEKKVCFIDGQLIETKIKGFVIDGSKQGINVNVDYSNKIVATVNPGKKVMLFVTEVLSSSIIEEPIQEEKLNWWK